MIQYEQTPDYQFFLCRQCRSHIALTSEYVFSMLTQEYAHRDTMVREGIFRNAFNVHVDYDDPTSYRMDGPNTFTRATCRRCRAHLGWEYVYVPVRSILIQPGRFLQKLNKLLVWDGSQILYALTREPIEDGSD